MFPADLEIIDCNVETACMDRMHVLIAEDECGLMQTMATILEMEGYAVSRAGNGAEALDIYRKSKAEGHAVDILVTDIEMPGMSGGQLVKTLHGSGENPGIVVVTAYGTRDLVAELLEQGVDGYLNKPYQADDLVGRINNLAEKLRTERRNRQYVENSIQGSRAMLHDIRQRVLGSREFAVLGKLAEGICHDLNNNLSVIIGFAELIADSTETGVAPLQRETIHRYVERVIAAANTAQHGIVTVQSFASPRARDYGPVELHRMLTDIAAITKKSLQKTVSVSLELKAQRTVVYAILPILQHAVINLLFNAGDAMPRGGTLTIRTRNCSAAAPKSGDAIEVTVSDTGCGMTEEVRGRMFEPFFTTKGDAGVGLGLASVLNAVQMLEGTVECDSTVGKGTDMRIILPLAAADSAPRE